ncbi:MAG: hypothetical protein U0401_29635 [Anaerolineae bacterium]
MLMGVLPDASSAETLLNNLSEADFNLADISIIMRDSKLQRAIAPDTGPLQGAKLRNLVAKLRQAGLSPAEVEAYRAAVAQGKVLVAMIVPPEAQQAAAGMFGSCG